MAASILEVADALVSYLNAGSYTAPYATITAVRHEQPEYTLEQLSTLRVTVIPPAMAFAIVTRGQYQEDLHIGIGVQKLTDGTQSARDALMLLVEEIAYRVLAIDDDILSGAAQPVEVLVEPLYDPEILRQTGVFNSVLSLVFMRYR